MFIFKSDRIDGKSGIYVMNMFNGKINLISKDRSWGWSPSWSNDNKVVYTTTGKIHFVNITSFKEKIIYVPIRNFMSFIRYNPSGSSFVFIEESTKFNDHHKALSLINSNGSGYRKLFITDEKIFFILIILYGLMIMRFYF